MGFSVKDSSVWKAVNAFFVKDAGSWKQVQNAYVKDGGSWKVFYSNFASSQAFAFAGIDQTFTVPAGVTLIRIKCWGAGGAGGFASSDGGGGGFVQADLVVVPGDVITVRVGGGGGYENLVAGGWPDGEPANFLGAGAGGGSSYVLITSTLIGAG